TGKHDLAEFGELLHRGWMLKRGFSSKITTSWIDEAYERARQAGAVGGKLLGAGGGGFMVFLVEPNKRDKVRERLKKLINVSVGIDSEGSKVVLYQPNGL
ncbi:MAG: GHMP kinase, partial [Pseudolabrys sp.]|nr:GHMP kinase [Pseudolabrys sp.]